MLESEQALKAACHVVSTSWPLSGDQVYRLYREVSDRALPFLQGVKVKGLEWAPSRMNDNSFISSNGFGENYVAYLTSGETWRCVCQDFPSLEAAKAAAQADYEARIVSAIEVPEQDGIADAVIQFLVKNGMLDVRSEYDASDVLAALEDNYTPEAPSPRAQALEELPCDVQLPEVTFKRGVKFSVLLNALKRRESWPENDRALSSQPVAEACEAYVGEMKKSAGTDYFVMIKSGDRELSIRKHQWKHHADYEAAEYNWLFNGGDKPDILAFHPVSGGSSILPASPEVSG